MESIQQRIQRVTAEDVEVVPYDPEWPRLFEREKQHLLGCLPRELIERIEHFGSTAVPGLSAKPVIDILVGVTSLALAQVQIVPVLETRRYEYFWRPTLGDDRPPWYAWFVRRDPDTKVRTHHIHMVEATFVEHWDRLLFRDYLVGHPDIAAEYQTLKMELAARHPHDHVRYTQEKGAFIERVRNLARSCRR